MTPQHLLYLQSKIADALKGLIPEAPFALLDFPDYDNIGDSAIYVGELELFKRHGLRPTYQSKVDAIDWLQMDEAIGDGPIFLHGGGNFGDIWPWFQPFREEVLERYRGRKVVQLPQTIHYTSQARIDQTARIIEKHGAFVLLVRDQPSYDLATRYFQCEVRFCPDMAFAMGRLQRASPANELLLHLRLDQEAAGRHDESKYLGRPGVISSDWPPETPELRRRVMQRTKLRHKIRRVITLSKGSELAFREMQYQALAETRLNRGIALLSSGRAVITDRLHGHILCSLLGIPHCVLDNSYGKTSAFISAWETSGDGVYQADSLDEAVETLRAQERLSV